VLAAKREMPERGSTMFQVLGVLSDPGKITARLYWLEDSDEPLYEPLHCWQTRALEKAGLIAVALPSAVAEDLTTKNPESRWDREVCEQDAARLIGHHTAEYGSAGVLRLVSSLLYDLRRYDGWEHRERERHYAEERRLRKEAYEALQDRADLIDIVRRIKAVHRKIPAAPTPLDMSTAINAVKRIVRPVRLNPGGRTRV
jgi:hypothetical protein